MHKRSLEITCYVVGAGAFGVFFRWLQVMMAFDEAGLNERSVFNVLVPVLILASAWLFNRFIKQIQAQRRYLPKEFCEALYNPGKLFTAARWVAGAVMALGALALFVAAETDVNSELLRILAILAFCSGITYPLVLGEANYEEIGRVHLLRFFMLLPVLTYSLWLIISYKMNDVNSVVWSYVVEIFAIIIAILSFFRVAGFAFGSPKPYRCLFYCMFGTGSCIMGLADSRNIGLQLILFSAAAMLLLYTWILISNLKQEEAPSIFAPDDGFERL